MSGVPHTARAPVISSSVDMMWPPPLHPQGRGSWCESEGMAARRRCSGALQVMHYGSSRSDVKWKDPVLRDLQDALSSGRPRGPESKVYSSSRAAQPRSQSAHVFQLSTGQGFSDILPSHGVHSSTHVYITYSAKTHTHIYSLYIYTVKLRSQSTHVY